MTLEVTREEIRKRLSGFDDFDREDVEMLIDLLLERFTLVEAWSWLAFYDPDLRDIPAFMVERGQGREVFKYAREMVAKGMS